MKDKFSDGAGIVHEIFLRIMKVERMNEFDHQEVQEDNFVQ